MIVVGIVGILVAIAAPNFAKYQSKSRQSEAKIALAAIFGGEKSFYSEYSSYIGSMEAIGYSPEGLRRFYSVGWVSSHSGTITGYNGDYTGASWAATNNSFACLGTPSALAPQLSGDAQTFVVAATGCIINGVTDFDTWNLDENKVLNNNLISI